MKSRLALGLFLCLFAVLELNAQKPVEGVSSFRKVEFFPPSDTIGLTFVKGGWFRRGYTLEQDSGSTDEYPVRRIRVGDFYISKCEITIAEYDSFCYATERQLPSNHGYGRGNYPLMDAGWYDAIEYCNWRSQKEGFKPCYLIDSLHTDTNNLSELDELKWTIQCDWTADGYRLPTEAEWEYAARGGKKRKRYLYSGAKTPDEVACWFKNKRDSIIYPVGHTKANALGIYDMSGNVWEWCWDWYHPRSYALAPKRYPTGVSKGEFRCLRGGSWVVDEAKYLRVSNRGYYHPIQSYNYFGFRVIRSIRDRSPKRMNTTPPPIPDDNP